MGASPGAASNGPDLPTRIPDDHPRAASLRVRERMKEAVRAGLVHPTGLIAHGRGEAFDYLLGERSPPEAAEAVAEAARLVRSARHPVLSLNGNVVALAAPACVELARAWPALALEVNLFHRTPERVTRLVEAMRRAGAGRVLGEAPDHRIPGLASDRGLCCHDGIGTADVVVVPLEDGDRCQALKAMGATVITVDLNPLSRTARTADVTIVDELTRALPALAAALRQEPSLPDGTPGGTGGTGGTGTQARSGDLADREDAPPSRYDNRDVLRRVCARMAAHLQAP